MAYGTDGAARPAPDGWRLSESFPELARDIAKGTAPPEANAATPHELHLTIVTAPAEFGVPLKQDRQFTPPFKVQVR